MCIFDPVLTYIWLGVYHLQAAIRIFLPLVNSLREIQANESVSRSVVLQLFSNKVVF